MFKLLDGSIDLVGLIDFNLTGCFFLFSVTGSRLLIRAEPDVLKISAELVSSRRETEPETTDTLSLLFKLLLGSVWPVSLSPLYERADESNDLTSEFEVDSMGGKRCWLLLWWDLGRWRSELDVADRKSSCDADIGRLNVKRCIKHP
jgi:hypothetical protein